MADLSTRLTAAFDVLDSLGVPVRMDGDPVPETEGPDDEVIVLALVSDTGRPAYGGMPTDSLIQTTCYAATLLRALELDALARAELNATGLHFRQSRRAPDPDSIGLLSEYTS